MRTQGPHRHVARPRSGRTYDDAAGQGRCTRAAAICCALVSIRPAYAPDDATAHDKHTPRRATLFGIDRTQTMRESERELRAYARVRVRCAGVPMLAPTRHAHPNFAASCPLSPAQAVPMSTKMASRGESSDQSSESRCQGAIAVPPRPVSRESRQHFRSHPLRRHAGAAGCCSRAGAQRYDPSGSEFRASGSSYDPPPASGPLWSAPRREAQVPAAVRTGQPGARFGSPSSAPTDRKFGAQTSKCGVIANEQGLGSRPGRVQELPRNGSLGLSEGTPDHNGDALTMTSRIGNPGGSQMSVFNSWPREAPACRHVCNAI